MANVLVSVYIDGRASDKFYGSFKCFKLSHLQKTLHQLTSVEYAIPVDDNYPTGRTLVVYKYSNNNVSVLGVDAILKRRSIWHIHFNSVQYSKHVDLQYFIFYSVIPYYIHTLIRIKSLFWCVNIFYNCYTSRYHACIQNKYFIDMTTKRKIVYIVQCVCDWL